MPITPGRLRQLTFARTWAKSSNSLTARRGKPVVLPSQFLLQLALSCLFVAFTWISAHPALATTCSCKQHSASAEASGTCSRTEDEKKCTLTFTTTTPEEYNELLKRLQSLNLTADPRTTLRLAQAGSLCRQSTRCRPQQSHLR